MAKEKHLVPQFVTDNQCLHQTLAQVMPTVKYNKAFYYFK